MSRRLKVSSAQLGPINLADSRASVVKRMTQFIGKVFAERNVNQRRIDLGLGAASNQKRTLEIVRCPT